MCCMSQKTTSGSHIYNCETIHFLDPPIAAPLPVTKNGRFQYSTQTGNTFLWS